MGRGGDGSFQYAQTIPKRHPLGCGGQMGRMTPAGWMCLLWRLAADNPPRPGPARSPPATLHPDQLQMQTPGALGVVHILLQASKIRQTTAHRKSRQTKMKMIKSCFPFCTYAASAPVVILNSGADSGSGKKPGRDVAVVFLSIRCIRGRLNIVLVLTHGIVHGNNQLQVLPTLSLSPHLSSQKLQCEKMS